MKHLRFYILLILFLPLSAFSQTKIWSVGSALTVPHRHLELSMFRASRFGLTKRLEISTKPLTLFVFPHVQLKKTWYKAGTFSFATAHGFYYPSNAMKVLKKRKIKDYLNENDSIPKIFAFKNELIFSKFLKKRTTCDYPNYLLSLKLGVQFANVNNDSTFGHIEHPILYPRTEIYHKRTLWYAGLDLDARLTRTINFCIDVDYLSLDDDSDVKDYAWEHKFLLMGELTNSVSISGGYKLCYTTYRERHRTTIYWFPLIDISWVYKFKSKKKEMGLFGN